MIFIEVDQEKMAPQSGPFYLIDLRRNRGGGFYLIVEINNNDLDNRHVQVYWDWSDHYLNRIYVIEHSNLGMVHLGEFSFPLEEVVEDE